MSCIPVNDEIRKLASSVNEDARIVSNLVGMWQEADPVNRENTYPSPSELSVFMKGLNEEEQRQASLKSLPGNNPIQRTIEAGEDYMQKADREFPAEVRRDRVLLISRLFSAQIDKAMEREAENMRKEIGREGISVEEKAELERQLSGLDRASVITRVGPASLFLEVRRIFSGYVNDSLENNIEAEKDTLSQYGLSEERTEELARETAEYKRVQYQKILDNYKALAEEASIPLRVTEGLIVDLGSGMVEEPDMNGIDEDGDPMDPGSQDNMEKEEVPYENWMVKYTMVASSQTLSKEVRKVISTIPRFDREGYVEEDDLGFERYLDPNHTHAALMNQLRYMPDRDDMIPLLRKLAARQEWANYLIEMLENDSQLFSQFYTNYRKDFIPYYIQRTVENSDGTRTVKTIPVNLPEGTSYLMDRWRDNILDSNILTPDSIYTREKKISQEKVKSNLGKVESLMAEYRKSGDVREFVSREDIAERVSELLKTIGVNTDSTILSGIFRLDSGTSEFLSVTGAMQGIFRTIEKDPGSYSESSSLAQDFRNAYRKIATTLDHVPEDAIESSSNEGGKTYYAHVQPSYIGNLFNRLKNATGNREKFDAFIENEFGQYKWFKKDGRWLNSWIEDLATDDRIREGFQHKVLLNIDRVDYSDLSSAEYTLGLINEYRGDPGKWAWYYVPVMSNAPISRFIRMPKYTGNYEEVILGKFLNVVEQEIGRIDLVRKRAKLIREGKVKAISNFDMSFDKNGKVKKVGGAEFKFLPGLNKLKVGDRTFLEAVSDWKGTDQEFIRMVEDSVRTVLDTGLEEMISRMDSLGVLERTEDGKYVNFPGISTEEGLRNFLREYYYNNAFATSQIIQITTTDLAYYKNMEDFYKRYKEVNSPAQRLDTKAEFKGELVGREKERTIYLKDSFVVSTAIEEIREVLDSKVKDGIITSVDRDAILSKYKDTNQTDGQAYRSLSSYRSVMVMSGKWDDRMESSYQNIINDRWNMEDFWTMWQTIKPFVYSQTEVSDGTGGAMKVPVQHKNSEFLLMAVHSMVAGATGRSPKLRAINDFMEKNQVDVVQFDSAVKVGLQGAIDLSGVDSYEDTYNKLMKDTGIMDGRENPEVVHTVSYEDYGIQQETPEHFLDAYSLVGTQQRKLIPADMPADAVITVDGREIPFKSWMNEYNSLYVENVLQSFISTSEIFSDPKVLEQKIQEEVRGSANYNNELIKATRLNSKGQFRIPLYDESMSNKIQPLLNSIVKNRITKQKIRGGACVQVSNYGLTKDLNVVFEGEGREKHIKYVECYMPWYSRKFFSGMISEDSGLVDIDKVPEELRKIIGYRIPTEDKYSMLPLYIKGFLPQQSGGAIMLPADITTITGSDFDIDKMYLMAPEFYEDTFYDEKAMKKVLMSQYKGEDRKEARNKLDIIFDQIRNGNIAFSEGTLEMGVYDWYMDNRESYKITRLRKVQYDSSLSPKENGTAARNNRIIDLAWGILTHPDTTIKILNPQGFDSLKKASRVATLLRSGISRDSLKKELGENWMGRLKDLSIDELDSLIEAYRTPYDPLSPATQVEIHKNNMTGSSMIGVYANHNSNHAMIQFTEVGLSEKNGAFRLFGQRFTSLHNQKAPDGSYINRNVSGFLAASVDNVKDPVLEAMNQNAFTADASMLLMRLGYSAYQVSLVMNQPVVREMVDLYQRESRKGEGRMDIVNRVSGKYKEASGLDIDYNKIKNRDFTEEELIGSLLDHSSNNENVSYLRNQAMFATLFERIMNTAETLGSMVKAMRSDTSSGGAGPFIANTESKMRDVEDFLTKAALDTFPLTQADEVLDNTITYEGDEDSIRRKILSSKLPILQAFYTLGLKGSTSLMGRYFPHYQDNFRDIVKTFSDMTRTGKLNGKTMKSIYSDLFAYIMNKSGFFSGREKRGYYINRFPDDFAEIVSRNEDIARLGFIKRLKVYKPFEDADIKVLGFENVGKLTPSLRENYSRDWSTLLYMDNPEANKLAQDLLLYSYYRGGFGFTPSTFIHLAPVSLLESIPGYIESERGILGSPDTYFDFIDQYVRNHLDNKSLIRPTQEGAIRFTNKEGEFMEVVPMPKGKISGEDRKMVQDVVYLMGVPHYFFFRYISKENEKGDVAYYRLHESADGNASYERVRPLGVRNTFLEYEYGKSAEESGTVIKGLPEEYYKNSDPETVNSIDDMDYTPVQESPEITMEEERGDSGPSIMDYDPVEVKSADNKKLC